MNTPTVLIVDHDADFAERECVHLGRHGFVAIAAANGAAMQEALGRHVVDIVLLDPMLPREDGLALVRWLRAARRPMPVLLLSARASAADRIVGLELGADDYLAKPCEPSELVARLRSVLRRYGDAPQASAAARVIAFDGWRLHRLERCVVAPDGQRFVLSSAEFQLLSVLLASPRSVCSRDHLIVAARQRERDGVERSIDLLVSRLRQKLAAAASGKRLIETVRGAGYRLNAQSVREQPLWQR